MGTYVPVSPAFRNSALVLFVSVWQHFCVAILQYSYNRLGRLAETAGSVLWPGTAGDCSPQCGEQELRLNLVGVPQLAAMSEGFRDKKYSIALFYRPMKQGLF